MSITPDSKDWTWVLGRPCPECGLDTSSFGREQIPAMIVANAAAWQPVLTVTSDAGVAGAPGATERPRPDTWSPLEYGCCSDGAAFTVETFGRYLVHDPVHHLYDVTGVRHTATS